MRKVVSRRILILIRYYHIIPELESYKKTTESMRFEKRQSDAPEVIGRGWTKGGVCEVKTVVRVN